MTDGARLGPSPTRADRDGPPLSVQRAAVLEAVQRASEPATIASLATDAGLHENTVREHLDALVVRGLVTRGRAAPSGGRGRPPVTFAATEHREPDARVRDYAGLASALAAHLARTSASPSEEARAAGRAWSDEVIDADAPPAADAADARQRIVATFDELGFAPAASPDAREIALHRCPLLDAAVKYPEVVCAAHRGLAEGMLERLGADGEEVRLEAFAEPGACRLYLGRPDEHPRR